MALFSKGLRIAREELTKQASLEKVALPSVPWLTAGRGAALGAGAGALEGGLNVAKRMAPGYGDDLARAVTDAGKNFGPESAELLAAEKALAKHQGMRADLYDDTLDATGKAVGWKTPVQAPMQYLKHFGEDVLRPVAGWAGAGGALGAGNQYMRRRAWVGAAKEYGPYAAAGVGGLAAYKAME